MRAEQNIMGLKETKLRVEKLISYYRELGDRELPFVRMLEARLAGLCDALGAVSEVHSR